MLQGLMKGEYFLMPSSDDAAAGAGCALVQTPVPRFARALSLSLSLTHTHTLCVVCRAKALSSKRHSQNSLTRAGWLLRAYFFTQPPSVGCTTRQHQPA